MAIYKDVEPLEIVTYQGESEDFDRGVKFTLEKIDALPAADVEEVKHGYWVEVNQVGKNARHIKYTTKKCSVCGYCNGRRKTKHCPDCGTKMDGRRDT